MDEANDADDLFDVPPMPASPAPAAKPAPGVDARKEVRVHVKWNARVLQPDGSVVPLRVRDVSETGIGLVSERPIASHAVLRLAVAVPDVNEPGRYTTVIGTFRSAHATVSAPDLVYGGVWLEIDGQGRELIRRWVRKLRG